MLLKVTRGDKPLELFNYLFDSRKQSEEDRDMLQSTKLVRTLLISPTVPGKTIEELIRNFRQIATLNPKVKKTIAHYSVSLPAEDNGKVSSARMGQISRALLEQLGHGRAPYFGIEHHDTSHRHWHLAASTVGYDGKWVDDSFDRYRVRQLEKELELKFGLKQTQTRPTAAVRNLSTGEYRLKRRKGQLVPKERLWAALDDCIPVSNSLVRLVMELRVRHPDISIQLKKKMGEHVGISFAVDGVAFSGSKLGRAYSLNGLERYHGIQRKADSKGLLDKILALPLTECESLYQAMEKRSRIEQPDTLGIEIEAWDMRRETHKPQLEF